MNLGKGMELNSMDDAELVEKVRRYGALTEAALKKVSLK